MQVKYFVWGKTETRKYNLSNYKNKYLEKQQLTKAAALLQKDSLSF